MENKTIIKVKYVCPECDGEFFIHSIDLTWGKSVTVLKCATCGAVHYISNKVGEHLRGYINEKSEEESAKDIMIRDLQAEICKMMTDEKYLKEKIARFKTIVGGDAI